MDRQLLGFPSVPGAVSRPRAKARQSPGLAGAANGEICRGDRASGEPAKDGGRCAADDNGFICCHCRGAGVGPVQARCLHLNRGLVYQPGVQGWQDAGKHQVDDPGLAVGVSCPVGQHVAPAPARQQRRGTAVLIGHPARRCPQALVSRDGCAGEPGKIGDRNLHAAMIAPGRGPLRPMGRCCG